jgi:hypothetical protein
MKQILQQVIKYIYIKKIFYLHIDLCKNFQTCFMTVMWIQIELNFYRVIII